jgi:hypothetical protein
MQMYYSTGFIPSSNLVDPWYYINLIQRRKIPSSQCGVTKIAMILHSITNIYLNESSSESLGRGMRPKEFFGYLLNIDHINKPKNS